MSQKKTGGLAGVIAGRTEICTVGKDGAGLTYHGYDIYDLADNASFEEVAHLLHHGQLPNAAELAAYRNTLKSLRSLPGELKHALEAIPADTHPMDVLRTGCSVLGNLEPETDFSQQRDAADRLLAAFPSMLLYWHRFHADGKRIETATDDDSVAGHFLHLLHDAPPSELHRRTLDTSLILYAEHEFNASTFTARVITATLSDFHSAIAGAIGALRGPLHGGANEAAMELIQRFDSPEAAEQGVREMLARNCRPSSATALAALALSIGPVPSALAQEGPSLEEIVVTARKIEENLNTAPVTVSAFTDSAIEELDLNSVADIARFTPGLSFSSAFGRSTERPVVRGQGNILAGVQFGVESGVAYFVDGMYYAGDIQSLDMSNLERVEVIKGPQSALYGRNTYSGAINFVTRRPEDGISGRLRVRGLESGEQEVNGSLGGELLDDVLAAQIALRHYSFDGQWTNLVTDKDIGQEETTSLNASFDWTPNDAFSLTARVQTQEDDDGTRPFFLQPATENNCFPGFRSLAYWPFVQSTNPNQYYCGEIMARPIELNDGPDADGEPNVIPGINPGSTFFGNIYSLGQGVAFSGVQRELDVLSLSARYDMDSGYSLTFQGSNRSEEAKTGSDSDHGPTNFFLGPEAFFALSNIKEYSEQTFEARIESPRDATVRWSAGVFNYDFEQDVTDIIPGGTTEDGTDNFVTNVAVFGSLGWDMSERATATIEVRSADEEKKQRDLDAAGMVEFEGAKSFTSVAPRLTVDYRVSDSTLLYGIYSEGVKPGGLNAAVGVSVGRPTYEQEESTNLEGGIKTTLLDGRMQANIAVYASNLDKYQLTTPVANPSGALNSVVTNQADGQVTGLEVDLLARLSEASRVGVTYALADSQFTSGCDEMQWTITSGGGRFNGDPATSLNPNGMGDCSVEGHQFPMGSRHQASAWIDWAQPFGSGSEFFGNVNVSYESKRYTQLHQLSYTGAAVLLGARVGIRGQNWSAALVGRNLGNEDAAILATRWLQSPYFTFASLNVAPPTADRSAPRAFFALPRRERQLGLEFTYEL